MEYIAGKFIQGAFHSLQGGRPENQDDCDFVDTPLGSLLVVCDGMGGGPGGKTASHIAKTSIIETIQNSTTAKDIKLVVKKAIENANSNIYSTACLSPQLKGMGSTAVVMLINKHSAIIGHVGDSRLYKLRDGFVIFRTKDHSLVGDMVRRDLLTEEQARLSTQSNILTRSVGVKSEIEVDIEEVPYEKGDRFALCTDGIWGALPNKDLVKLFSTKKNLPVLVELISTKIDDIGKQNGGMHDNLTLAIVETSTNSIIKEQMNRKAKIILSIITLVALISLIFNFVQLGNGSKISKLQEDIKKSEADIHYKDSILKTYSDSIYSSKEREKISKNAVGRSQETIDILNLRIDSLKKRNKELSTAMEQVKNDVAKKEQQKKEEATRQTKLKQDAKTALQTLKSANQQNFMQRKNNAETALNNAGFPNLARQVHQLKSVSKVQSIINQIK